MPLKPITENQAQNEVKELYGEIKRALNSQTLPVFFTYLGVFPDYLTYITPQLIKNLKDAGFKELEEEIHQQSLKIIKSSLSQSSEIQAWLNRYRFTPAFYHFQKDLDVVHRMNLKLVFIFIALREAVKGWAVAAKQLPGYTTRTTSINEDNLEEEKLVFEEITAIMAKNSDANIPLDVKDGQKETGITASKLLEKNLLIDYLHLTRQEYLQETKQDHFVIMRVGLEKMILSTLPLFPNLIFSPINEVLRLTSKYPDFDELLYLLSEHFPTLAMQKFIFSGYLLE